jgi:serine/threonine-protein kinase
VLKALWEAHEHERRIVHRDIKPSNILVMDQPGDDDFVKVLDFGISRALAGTTAGSIGLVGSPKTMAPEQWEGRTVSPRTDLYAVGCTVYEMLSGSPVYFAASPVVMGYKHLHEAAPDLRARVADGTPARLVAWVEKMMQKDPSKRPETAGHALGELREIGGR